MTNELNLEDLRSGLGALESWIDVFSDDDLMTEEVGRVIKFAAKLRAMINTADALNAPKGSLLRLVPPPTDIN